MVNDSIKWHPVVEVLKYEPGTVLEIMREFNLEDEPDGKMLAHLRANEGVTPDEITRAEGNSLVNTGKTRLGDLIIGTGQAFTNTRGVAGVGDSSTATTVGMVTLQAGSNTWYRGLDATWPQSSVGVLTASSTFGISDANYVWNEWCWAVATATVVPSATFNTATTTGVMLNRAVQALGTKVSGAIWTLNATVTIT